MPEPLELLRRREALARWFFVACGIVIGLVMVARSQVGGDQLNMLARGWLLAVAGQWYQFGMPTSAGGLAPGGLTSLVVGLPLMLWQDFRAPTLLLWLGHLAGWLLLDRSIGGALGRSGRLLLVILYWLSPWQLYFSGHLWNANWMFPVGAVHLATAFASRRRPSFWASAIHVAALGLAFQLHASAPLLGVVSVLLVLGGRVRIQWSGVVAGAAFVALTLAPWALAVGEAPAAVPGETGFLGRGLLYVYPMLRGVLFWLRYGSLAVSNNILRLDFTPVFGAGLDSVLTPVFRATLLVVGAISLAAPVAGHWRLWRRRRQLIRRSGPQPVMPSRRWLEGYAVASLLGAFLSFALSPTTVMMWQGFVAFQGAVLPVVLLAGAAMRSRRRATAARLLVAWAAIAVVFGLVMAVASPHYRQGGRRAWGIEVKDDLPMLHDLGIAERCTVPVVGGDAFTPDPFRSWGVAPVEAPAPEPCDG